MKFVKNTSGALILSAILFSACNDDIAPQGPVTITREIVTLNPTGYSPLTATLHVETSPQTKISIRVAGKHGDDSDVINDFQELGVSHDVSVLGLYAAFDNTVELIFRDAAGTELGRKSYTIKTSAVPYAVFPSITIDTKKEGMMAAGMTLVSYFGYSGNQFPQYPFIFDAFGDIRWYLDFRTHPVLNNLFYDDGMERLQNGNLYFGDISSNAIYEMDFQGKTINTWSFPGYQFHHNVQEKPNGNFLVTVTKQGSSTTEDQIIEIDRNSKQIITTWDLRVSLQDTRQILTSDLVDWIHINAVVYDPSDNTIVVSGRTQALVKLDQDNNVVWIMGPHKGWGTAGNGADLNTYLLEPLDQNDQPIVDQSVLDGDSNHPDFEWNWYQHAPLIMPNGHVMVFDNGGDNRNFSGAGQYSRAVEFEVNNENKTVKQIWKYGENRGPATFAHIVSDVDFLSDDNHVIFSPGSTYNSTYYGKVVELDYNTQDVVFEATLSPTKANYGITFHRTERLKLYF